MLLFSRRKFCCCLPATFVCGAGNALSAEYPAAPPGIFAATFVCGSSFWSSESKVRIGSRRPTRDMVRALRLISGLTGIRPPVGFVDEESKAILQVAQLDTSVEPMICINDTMLARIMANGGQSYEVMTGLFAHEFCHVMQMKNKCFLNFGEGSYLRSDNCFRDLIPEGKSRRIFELHCDFFAGWVLGVQDLLTTNEFAGYCKDVFLQGEYFETEENHHGSPRERLNAMADGFWFGKNGTLSGYRANQFMEDGKKAVDSKSAESAFNAGQAALLGRKM